MTMNVSELAMPVVQYGSRDDDETLNQAQQQETSEEHDGYSVILTVPRMYLHVLYVSVVDL